MLLNILAKEMKLPDYFGNNWDALDECLRDFWWLPTKKVILIHEDIPALASQELRTYLEILSDAIHSWHGREEHQFIVVFPQEARNLLQEIEEK